jgi:hypothetical protein
MAERGERKKSGAYQLPSLADLGVTNKQSSRWQALAALPVEEQEAKVAGAAAAAIAGASGESLNMSGIGRWCDCSQPRNELRNFAIDDLALSFGFLPSSLLKVTAIGERIRRQGADKTNQ